MASRLPQTSESFRGISQVYENNAKSYRIYGQRKTTLFEEKMENGKRQIRTDVVISALAITMRLNFFIL